MTPAPLSNTAREVWRDWERERGTYSVERERWWLLGDADADAYAYADAGADAYAYADADAYAYADADAYADAYSAGLKEEHMQGLYAVTVWQGGGRMVVRLGWFRPRGSDGTHEASWCTVYRPSAAQRMAEVWSAGPKAAAKAKWEFSAPLPCDDVQRLHLVPLAKLDASLWASVCPRPEGWE